jgi:hypothetical protein
VLRIRLSRVGLPHTRELLVTDRLTYGGSNKLGTFSARGGSKFVQSLEGTIIKVNEQRPHIQYYIIDIYTSDVSDAFYMHMVW